MNTSQFEQLTTLINQRRELRDFQTDFANSTVMLVGTEAGGNELRNVTITTGYRNAVQNIIDARLVDVNAGFAALGVTQDD